jgi:hypothetical protein
LQILYESIAQFLETKVQIAEEKLICKYGVTQLFINDSSSPGAGRGIGIGWRIGLGINGEGGLGGSGGFHSCRYSLADLRAPGDILVLLLAAEKLISKYSGVIQLFINDSTPPGVG